MRKYIKLFIICGVVVLIASCQHRKICPAYQSTYIFDDSVRSRLFSRFEADSLPKRYPKVERDQFGIIEKKSRRAKLRSIEIIAMRNVLPPKKEPDTAMVHLDGIRRDINRTNDGKNQ